MDSAGHSRQHGGSRGDGIGEARAEEGGVYSDVALERVATGGNPSVENPGSARGSGAGDAEIGWGAAAAPLAVPPGANAPRQEEDGAAASLMRAMISLRWRVLSHRDSGVSRAALLTLLPADASALCATQAQRDVAAGAGVPGAAPGARSDPGPSLRVNSADDAAPPLQGAPADVRSFPAPTLPRMSGGWYAAGNMHVTHACTRAGSHGSAAVQRAAFGPGDAVAQGAMEGCADSCVLPRSAAGVPPCARAACAASGSAPIMHAPVRPPPLPVCRSPLRALAPLNCRRRAWHTHKQTHTS